MDFTSERKRREKEREKERKREEGERCLPDLHFSFHLVPSSTTIFEWVSFILLEILNSREKEEETREEERNKCEKEIRKKEI